MSGDVLSQFWYRIAPLKLQFRAHAQVYRHRYRGHAWYVIEDSAAGRYHRFTPAVFQFVGQMDGQRTVNEIWLSVVDKLGDDAPTQVDIVQLLSQLHAADLLRSDIPPDAAELFHRHSSMGRSKWTQRLISPMSLKIPLFDPNRLLAQTLPLALPFMGRLGIVLWLLAVVPGIVLAVMHWTELSTGVLDHVFATENLVAIALIYPLLKVVHELGHGWACKAGGGEVHELGFMFLVFIPVPYVDVSASSAFRSKYQRAGVAAAGIAVETFIAALAMFVWVLAEPGLVRSLAYNVMLIAGVSTVIFNANPLMKFDGYYVMADLLEIPNLAQRASKYWGHLVDRHVFGAEVDDFVATRGERAWFIGYAPLAMAYRLSILFGIALLVASQFFIFGLILALWSLIMGIAFPVGKFLREVFWGRKLQRKRKRAAAITLGAMAAAVALIGLVPAPLHTLAEGVVWLPEEGTVRAAENGFVQQIMQGTGTAVTKGTPLIQLSDSQLVAEATVFSTQIDALKAQLTAQQFEDISKADLTREEISVYEASLLNQNTRIENLMIASARDGTFMLPMSGDLVERYVRRGDILGYVVAEGPQVVRVIIPQADAELVLERLTAVEVMFPDRLDAPLEAQVLRVVPAASRQLPSRALALAGGGRVAVDPGDSQGSSAVDKFFQLDLEVPALGRADNYGSRVYVRFQIGSEPLAAQWYRRVRQVFLSVLNT